MAERIIMDAGHGGRDSGAVYDERVEQDDNLAMTLEVGRILSEMGFDVVYTRQEDIYQAPFRKATKGNELGGDLFVSIHRNSSPTPDQYQGIETLVYSLGGFPEEVAENINEELEEVGYIAMLQADKEIERIENIKELIEDTDTIIFGYAVENECSHRL